MIGHPARKPTVDELLATRDRMNRARADFLKVDLETALTFVKIAHTTDDEFRKERNCRAARKAYETVVRLQKKVDLTTNDGLALKRGLDRLKSELERLGETF
jgi:hypothetical protein